MSLSSWMSGDANQHCWGDFKKENNFWLKGPVIIYRMGGSEKNWGGQMFKTGFCGGGGGRSLKLDFVGGAEVQN